MIFKARTIKSLFAQVKLAGVEKITAFGKANGLWEARA